jgi:hypothetical protein
MRYTYLLDASLRVAVLFIGYSSLRSEDECHSFILCSVQYRQQ